MKVKCSNCGQPVDLADAVCVSHTDARLRPTFTKFYHGKCPVMPSKI